MNNKARFNLLFVLIAVSGVFLVHDLWVRSQSVAVIPYSRFQQLLEEKKVKEILGIPEEIRVVQLMPLGYPVDPKPVQKSRLPFDMIVKYDHW